MKVNVYLCILDSAVGDYWMCCVTCVITEIVITEIVLLRRLLLRRLLLRRLCYYGDCYTCVITEIVSIEEVTLSYLLHLKKELFLCSDEHIRLIDTLLYVFGYFLLCVRTHYF